MKTRFESLLGRYGQSVAITSRRTGKTIQARAFVQPILRRREDIPIAATALGAVSGQRWLYLGSGALPLSPGDLAECGAAALTVQEARPVYWQDEIAYYWALLRPKKEAAV